MAEPKPFRPSARQRRVAEAACSLAFSVQPRLVCAEAQIPHSTYYRWQKNPAFSAWLAATVLQCLAANSPFLLLNTLQAALTGDASARKLIFQFCIAPRLAPAMAALPAPGLEAILGLPNDAAPLGLPTAAPSNKSGAADPAAKKRVPSNSESGMGVPPVEIELAPVKAQQREDPIATEQSECPASASQSPAQTESKPSKKSAPSAPPTNDQPPSETEPAAPCLSPVPSPSSPPSASETNPSPFPPGIAPMWRVNKEGKLEPLPRAYW